MIEKKSCKILVFLAFPFFFILGNIDSDVLWRSKLNNSQYQISLNMLEIHFEKNKRTFLLIRISKVLTDSSAAAATWYLFQGLLFFPDRNTILWWKAKVWVSFQIGTLRNSSEKSLLLLLYKSLNQRQQQQDKNYELMRLSGDTRSLKTSNNQSLIKRSKQKWLCT